MNDKRLELLKDRAAIGLEVSNDCSSHFPSEWWKNAATWNDDNETNNTTNDKCCENATSFFIANIPTATDITPNATKKENHPEEKETENGSSPSSIGSSSSNEEEKTTKTSEHDENNDRDSPFLSSSSHKKEQQIIASSSFIPDMKMASRVVYFVDQQCNNEHGNHMNDAHSEGAGVGSEGHIDDQTTTAQEDSTSSTENKLPCKNDDNGIVKDNAKDDYLIEYGCLGHHDKATCSTLILENVLMPLLMQNNPKLSSSTTMSNTMTESRNSIPLGTISPASSSSSSTIASSSLHMNHAKKFISRVNCDPHHQTENNNNSANNGGSGCVLKIPDIIIKLNDNENDDNDVDAIVEDYDSIQTLELAAEEWYRIISTKMEQEQKEKPKKDGPLDEVIFWRRRHSVLTTLNEQTKKSSVQKIMKVLRIAGVSPVYRKVNETFQELNQLYIEAADNAKFLITLERHFQTLVDESLKTITGILPSLIDSMRIVWTVSRHYNRDERLVPLMERVAWQLMSRVREYIDIKTILRGHHHQHRRRNYDDDDDKDDGVNSSVVLEAKSLLESWRLTYLKVRAKIEQGGPGQRRWEFDRGRLFEKTDYMAVVCSNLHEVIVTIDQFRSFLGPELAAITGESNIVDAVAQKVEDLPTFFESIKFDPFDRAKSDAWSAVMSDFHKEVRNIETCAGSSIERAFQKLRSAEGAFDLLEKFQNLQQHRPSIHRIEERYSDILHQYTRELHTLENIFRSGKSSPDIFTGYKQAAGSIAWALNLYQRAKQPILRFITRDGFLSSEFGNELKQRYLSFARSIDAYKDHVFDDWKARVVSLVKEGLRKPILRRVEGAILAKIPSLDAPRSSTGRQKKASSKSVLHASFDRTASALLQLASNFPKEIFELVDEAKQLAKLGFSTPESALSVALQEDKYHRFVVDIDVMAKGYNETLASLSTLEKFVLKDHLRKMELALTPGLTKLNWMSQRIVSFITASNHAIERFKSVLERLRKHSASIETLFLQIETTSLISPDDFNNKSNNLMSVSEFSNIVESLAEERLGKLVHGYQSLKPLVVNVEMVVTESDDGASPALFDYYLFLEKRTYNALVQMIIRSLLNLLVIISSRNNEAALCQINLTLNGKDLVLAPSVADIYKHLNRCVRIITESAKRFVRWMDGTCIETSPQLQGDDVMADKFIYSFYDDIFHNKHIMTCLVQVNQQVHGIFKKIVGCKEEWRLCGETCNLWDPKRKSQMDKYIDMDPPVSFYESNIAYYEDLVETFNTKGESLCTNMQYNIAAKKTVHFLQIDCLDVALGMSKLAIEWKNDLCEVLHLTAKKRLDSLNTKIEKIQNDLTTNPQSMIELKAVLGCITETSNIDMHTELLCRDIEERYTILKSNEIAIPGEEVIVALSASPRWRGLVVNSKTKNLRLSDAKDKFREVTRGQVKDFAEKVKKARKDLTNCGPGSSSVSLEDGLELLRSWQKTFKEMSSKKHELSNAEEMFDLPISAYPDLIDIENKMNDLASIYDIYCQFKEFEEAQSSSLWNDVQVTALEDGIAELEISCKKYHVGQNIYTFKSVQGCIFNFKESIAMIKSLKNDSIKPRHWEKLAAITNTSLEKNFNTLTLAKIFAMELNMFPNDVAEVINEASQEGKIEISIREIQDFWDKADLCTQRYSKDGTEKGFILRSADELILQLEDHMLRLQAMSSSKYVSIFKSMVKIWEKQLNTIAECLNLWFLVQRKWMYLESIFVGADDIRLQLPEEAKKFDGISKAFQSIMNATNENPNIVRACCAEKRLETFQALTDELDQCQKRLSDYLDTKRNAFARFYFISDDELISIMGSSDPSSIEPHLLKVFDNVKRLGFGRGKKSVVNMESSETESFDLVSTVAIDGPVEVWMTKVEEEMKQSLWSITKEAIFRYAKEKRTDWIANPKSLGMNTICGSQTWFTWFTEDAFRRVDLGEKHALKELEVKLNKQLSDMVAMVRSPIDKIVRKKVNTLLIIDVHARDIISSFVRESVLNAKQFEWESQLRFYWIDDDCLIKQCTGSFRYGFEYMGLNGRLVITPLTDRCYMTLTQALTFKLGGSPSGPAGTGKTETVKDLAKSLALPCFVINCGEGLDYKAMGATFSGLVQCGAWGCFDEFNRINIEVLSVVSAQLKAIQNALIYDSPTVNIGIGHDITIKRVKGFATSGVFITMNPGYAGRTELPESLKALFRPVTMVVPDLQKIAENMLFSEGFDDSKSLAKKMVVLYKLSKEQLSKQYHYDFGLRSMKTVLVMAGDLKRQYSKIPEDLVLMRILRDANMPKYIFEDVPLFLGLINDLFPQMDCPRVGYEDLKKEIANDLERNGFKCTDDEVHKDQVDKIVQLFETQKVRHTTMVVGPTGGGKSLVLKTLANARLKSEGTTVKTFIINPKAQTLNELYGTMDPTTRDWTDGVLSKIFRDLNQPLTVGREKEIRWIVFDGDVDAIWVENMNSVMDDNKLLTLPNGERIRLQPHCSMICEVFDLQYASPATISRCGMVWVDPKNLGYKPYYERWLKQRLGEKYIIRDGYKTHVFLLTELFEKYVVPSINYILNGVMNGEVKEKLVQVISVGDIELCKQLCTMLTSFLPPPNKANATSAQDIESIYVYCVLWSMGAQLDDSSRKKFDLFLKSICTETTPDGNLYEHYYCIENHRWASWENRITKYTEPLPFYFHQIMVPTAVSVLYRDMLERLAPLRPCLFVGESGTAKTLTVEKYIASLPVDNFAKLKINMSSRTSSQDVQVNIEANIEKRLGTVFGPVSGKKLIVFVDDMNMPKVDSYGTQQPIALLLTLLDHGFIYAYEKDIVQKTVKDLQYIAAMGPPGGGRNMTDPRFVARFNTFYLTKPSNEVLQSIYNNIIETRMTNYSNDVREVTSKITEATLTIYEFVVSRLPPTPTKFHYIFTLRDISRVYEGLCSTTPQKTNSANEFIRLWRHEINRIFFDRLSTDDDLTVVSNELSNIIQNKFSSSSGYALQDPLLYGDFEHAVSRIVEDVDDPRLYGDVESFSVVQKIFNQIMESYNAVNEKKPLTLVLFEMALNHLVRIMRILKHPRGHALLIGIGGSGKQSLTRLAAFASGYGLYEITLIRGYSESDFKEDLKELFKKLTSGPVVFLFTDAHVAEEGFLEYVNNLLSTGIPPALFDEEEKDAICTQVKEQALASGANETNEGIWSYFDEQCRNNLHIVLAMSPSGEKLRLRCRNFPALVSSCIVDWFFEWPSEALEKVANTFLSNESNIPPETKEHVSSHMVIVHKGVTAKAQDFRAILKRQYFVTPKNYIDFIAVFRELLRSNIKKNDSATRRLDGGLTKLAEAANSVDRMQVELREKKVTVDAKTNEVEKLIEVIQQKTKIATESSEEASKKQEAAESQAKIIVQEKAKADSALMEALPAVEAAAEALNNIRREDLQELKAFNNPSIHVKIVCQMCTVLRPTGEKLDDSWGDSKKMLGNPRLIDLLKEYPKDSMTEKMYRSCQKILKENKKHDITIENMATKSQAAKGLLVWILAILSYYEVAKNVEPLREKVKAMEKAQAQTEAELSKLNLTLEKLNEELSDLRKGYKEANEDLSNLQLQAAQMEKRLTAASALIGGLTGEKSRWSADIKKLASSRTMLVGDSLLGSSFTSYMGAFTADYRYDLIYNTLMEDLKSRPIPFTNDFKVNDMLTTDSEVQCWNADGLPADEHSIQNGILTTSGSRFPLCIDPQQQAVTWIKNTFAGEQLIVKSLNESDFIKHLELSIQFGKPFLFENVGEEIDPVLDPILNKEVSTENSNKTVTLGDKVVDWDDNFRLFFCTKLSNPLYSPELMGKVMLVNYCVTRDGLDDQLLNEVVSHERPELEDQFSQLVENMASNANLLVAIENSLLRELSSSQGNILDNEDLIATLDEAKQKATEIKKKISEAQTTKEEINKARGLYKTVSKRGSTLFFASSGLSTINPMYEISLESFLKQFVGALDNADKDDSLEVRLQNLLDSCMQLIYDFTCTGLFERHKLAFSFHLACMVSEESGSLDSSALNAFIKGDTSLDPIHEDKPSSVPWMSDAGWKDLLFFSQLSDLFLHVKNEFVENSADFKAWYDAEAPEDMDLPGKCCKNLSSMQKLCMIRALRPDRCYNAVKLFVAKELGDSFIQPPMIDYKRIYRQSSPQSPTLFILSPGADPQLDIQHLGEELGFTSPNRFQFVSLGQGQGRVAMEVLETGRTRGNWVLFQNCHLLISWLKDLDRALEEMKTPHRDFRLWLTTEPTNQFPLSILQKSFKVVTEPPDGLKLNMRSTLAKIDKDVFEECPHTSFRPLIYVLSFLHAVVQERRKYGKIGWNVMYDFNESDFTISRKLMGLYLSKAWDDEDESMPWGSLKYLVGDAMYGGRVSDNMDRRVLSTYLNEYFGDFLFDTNNKFFFSREGFDYVLPESNTSTIEEFRQHMETFPLTNSPAVFGLHPNAEIGYFMSFTNDLWYTLVSLQPRTGDTGGGLSREEHIYNIATELLTKIPIIKPDIGSFDIDAVRNELMAKNGGEQPTPCQVVLLQEIELWNALCKRMSSSLILLKKALDGEIGMNERLDEISDALFNGYLPLFWSKLAPATEKKLGSWMVHFTKRYRQYEKWIKDGEPQVFWLSGLHIPESYLTALVQTTCRRKGWPLDKSTMYTLVTKYTSADDISKEKGNTLVDGSYISGLYLEGAGWDSEQSQLKRQNPKELVVELPLLQVVPIESNRLKIQNTFRTPVYTTSQRRNAAGVGLVFEADLSTDVHSSLWTLQGVAIVMNVAD